MDGRLNCTYNSLDSVHTSVQCTYMEQNHRVNLRVSSDELMRWREWAEREGKNLSDWIRSRCEGKEVAAKPVPKKQDKYELCEHGAAFSMCKKWGCRNYLFPNGRK